MNKIAELIITLIRVALGFYVAIWIFFIGGIIQIVGAVQVLGPDASIDIALGVMRIILSGEIGILVIAIFKNPSLSMAHKKVK